MAETESVQFFIGTQSLRCDNQVFFMHLCVPVQCDVMYMKEISCRSTLCFWSRVIARNMVLEG